MKLRSGYVAVFFAMTSLVVALTVMGLTAALPFVRLSWLEQTIAHKQDELFQLRKQITREGELRKENSALAALGQDASLLLAGETTGISGANLQRLMNDIVLEQGGSASSFQILPPQEDGNLMRIPMSLSISVGIDGLRDILHSIETGTPLIFIDDITMRPAPKKFRVPDPHFVGPFAVTLKVSAFAPKNEAS